MGEGQCQNCLHFIQHYTFSEGRVIRVFCGHCTCLKLRHKRPDAKACENFIFSPPDTDAFVTKEYLTKKLLKHVLELELLPKIEE